jgi:hypothetical protein
MSVWQLGCALFAAAVILAAHVGCGPCTENNVATPIVPPVITVVNAATGQAICDATVIAQSTAGPLVTPNDVHACAESPFWCPDASVQLVAIAQPDASSASCPYGVPLTAADGAVDGIGPIGGPPCVLHVSKAGFTNAPAATVGSTANGCDGTRQQKVTIQLQPN